MSTKGKTMTAKKIQTKKAAAKKPAENAKTNGTKEKSIGLFSWLFVPDFKQGWRRWCVYAGLFACAVWAATMAGGANGLQAKFSGMGMNVSFWEALNVVLAAALEDWAGMIVAGGAAYFAAGMFIFMPRRTLDRHGFFAAVATFLFWAVLGGVTFRLAAGEPAKPLIFIPAIAVMFFSAVAMLAATARRAKKIGTKPIALFLSFPFGWTLFEWAGFFLPTPDESPDISIRYNWFRKFVGFMMDDFRGQILLALVVLAMFARSPSPWEAFMLVFFGGLYFWKKPAWMIKRAQMLSRAAVVVNILAVSFSAYYISAMPAGGLALAG